MADADAPPPSGMFPPAHTVTPSSACSWVHPLPCVLHPQLIHGHSCVGVHTHTEHHHEHHEQQVAVSPFLLRQRSSSWSAAASIGSSKGADVLAAPRFLARIRESGTSETECDLSADFFVDAGQDDGDDGDELSMLENESLSSLSSSESALDALLSLDSRLFSRPPYPSMRIRWTRLSFLAKLWLGLLRCLLFAPLLAPIILMRSIRRRVLCNVRSTIEGTLCIVGCSAKT